MNAKADWLKKDGEILVPKTLASCVFDEDGKSVDEVIEEVKEDSSTAQGRNKMPFPYKMGMKYVDSGITFEVNNDGSINVTGTVSNYTTFAFVKKRGEYELLPGTYIITGGISNDIYIRVQNVTTDTDITIATDTGNGATFTLTEKSKIYIYLQVRNNVTVDTVIYPMLELGQVSHGFEPPAESNMAIKNELDHIFSDEWTQRTYEAGEYAVDGNRVWKCLVTNSERPKEGANWHAVKIMEEIGAVKEEVTALNSNMVQLQNVINVQAKPTAADGVTIVRGGYHKFGKLIVVDLYVTLSTDIGYNGRIVNGLPTIENLNAPIAASHIGDWLSKKVRVFGGTIFVTESSGLPSGDYHISGTYTIP